MDRWPKDITSYCQEFVEWKQFHPASSPVAKRQLISSTVASSSTLIDKVKSKPNVTSRTVTPRLSKVAAYRYACLPACQKKGKITPKRTIMVSHRPVSIDSEVKVDDGKKRKR